MEVPLTCNPAKTPWEYLIDSANKKENRGLVTELVDKLKRMVGLKPALSDRFQKIKDESPGRLMIHLHFKYNHQLSEDQRRVLTSVGFHDVAKKLKASLEQNMDGATSRAEVREVLRVANNAAKSFFEKYNLSYLERFAGLEPHESINNGDAQAEPLPVKTGGKREPVSVQTGKLPIHPGPQQQAKKISGYFNCGNNSYTPDLMAQIELATQNINSKQTSVPNDHGSD